jgi:hypothetical protein
MRPSGLHNRRLRAFTFGIETFADRPSTGQRPGSGFPQKVPGSARDRGRGVELLDRVHDQPHAKALPGRKEIEPLTRDGHGARRLGNDGFRHRPEQQLAQEWRVSHADDNVIAATA